MNLYQSKMLIALLLVNFVSISSVIDSRVATAEITLCEPPCVGFYHIGDGDKFAEELQLKMDEPSVKNAKFASFWGPVITPKQIQALGELKSLEELEFWNGELGVNFSTEVIEQFSHLPDIKVLKIRTNCDKNTHWSGLRHLSSLLTLDIFFEIYGSEMNQEDMNGIGNLSNLKKLYLSCDVDCNNFDWLRRLKNLNEIGISVSEKSPVDQAFAAVHELQSLTFLKLLGESTISEADLIDLVTRKQNLETLGLHKIDPNHLHHFSSQKMLKHLDLYLPESDACDLSFVNDLNRLQGLSIANGIADLNQIKNLEGHPSLRTLQINCPEATVEWEEQFLKIPELEFVKINPSLRAVDVLDVEKGINKKLRQRYFDKHGEFPN